MWMKFWHLLLHIIGLVENHTTDEEDEVLLTLEDQHREAQERGIEQIEDREETITEVRSLNDRVISHDRIQKPTLELWKLFGSRAVLAEPFDGPLEAIPLRRYGDRGVYRTYGRAPKEKNSNFPTAKLVVERGLPGNWNNGTGRLYVLHAMAPYLREFLRRCGILGVLPYFTKLGAYNHRRIRHDAEAELSLHAWAAAVDFNTKDNTARYRSPTWKDSARKPLPGPSMTARYGPIPPPFSRGWQRLWPAGVPYLAVLAAKSVGFEWGGDWGRHQWQLLVEAFGVGYDEEELDRTVPWIHDALEEWKTITFIDPMHIQLKWERDRKNFLV